MTQDNEYNGKLKVIQNDLISGSADEDETGGSNAGTGIDYQLFIEGGSRPPLKGQQLDQWILGIANSQLGLVEQQYLERLQRTQLKEHQQSLRGTYGGPGGSGETSQYKTRPDLENFFHDKQVTNVPNDYQAETNKTEAEELRLLNRPQFVPHFNPKPSPYKQ